MKDRRRRGFVVMRALTVSGDRRMKNIENKTATDKKNNVMDLGLSAIGAAIGISLALWFVADNNSPFLLASDRKSVV